MNVGNAVFPDDDFRINAGRVDVPQHFGDAPDGAARRCGPTRELDAHPLAGGGAALPPGGNDDVHHHTPVERHDEAHSAFPAVVAAHDQLVGALESPDDASLCSAAVFDALDAHDDAIALHGFVEVSAGDVDVAAGRLEWALRSHEPVTGGMRLQPADVQVHLLGQAKPVSADLHEIARAHHRLDVTFERRTLVARDLEDLQQFAHAGRVMDPIAHERKNLFA